MSKQPVRLGITSNTITPKLRELISKSDEHTQHIMVSMGVAPYDDCFAISPIPKNSSVSRTSSAVVRDGYPKTKRSRTSFVLARTVVRVSPTHFVRGLCFAKLPTKAFVLQNFRVRTSGFIRLATMN